MKHKGQGSKSILWKSFIREGKTPENLRQSSRGEEGFYFHSGPKQKRRKLKKGRWRRNKTRTPGTSPTDEFSTSDTRRRATAALCLEWEGHFRFEGKTEEYWWRRGSFYRLVTDSPSLGQTFDRLGRLVARHDKFKEAAVGSELKRLLTSTECCLLAGGKNVKPRKM